MARIAMVAVATAVMALVFCVQAARLETTSHGKLDLERPLLQKSIVDIVNSNPKAGWKAGINERFINSTVRDLKRLCGVLPKPAKEIDPSRSLKIHPRGLELPKNFDAREAWPQCTSIKAVLDQGHCGSCWAFGAVEALTDRFCILTNENVTLSENDLLACCGFECGYGCDGGYPYAAWQYFKRNGVVTSQCDPYFDQAGCSHPGCEPGYDTPKCLKQCRDNEAWTNSKHFSLKTYSVNSNIYDIQAEIYTNGPVEVSYSVYEDFAHYKSGVYKYVHGEYLGGHAVKVIGWGTTDDGEDYWIVANSWNRSWGEDGFFKIARGTDECGIESEPVAGIPLKKFTSLSDMFSRRGQLLTTITSIFGPKLPAPNQRSRLQRSAGGDDFNPRYQRSWHGLVKNVITESLRAEVPRHAQHPSLKDLPPPSHHRRNCSLTDFYFGKKVTPLPKEDYNPFFTVPHTDITASLVHHPPSHASALPPDLPAPWYGHAKTYVTDPRIEDFSLIQVPGRGNNKQQARSSTRRSKSSLEYRCSDLPASNSKEKCTSRSNITRCVSSLQPTSKATTASRN